MMSNAREMHNVDFYNKKHYMRYRECAYFYKYEACALFKRGGAVFSGEVPEPMEG